MPAFSQTDDVPREQVAGEAVVQRRQKGAVLGAGEERITSAGLAKMACCTVAESFENSASVSVGYSDAVTGTRQIKLLGLTGAYTQLLDESRPFLRGQASPYALSWVPGQWLKGISISKGTSSVTAGHEAIAGQINMDFRKPTDDEKLFVNLYLDDRLRPELNVASALPLKPDKSLSTILLLHGAFDTDGREDGAMDRDGDGFRDMPRTRTGSVANKWLWLSPGGLQMRWGWSYTNEGRLGGQTGYDRNSHDATAWQDGFDRLPALYGSYIANEAASGYVKMALPAGRRVSDEKQSSVALTADFEHFGTDSHFGLREVRGNQNAAMVQLLWNAYFTHAVSLAAGLRGRWEDSRERHAFRAETQRQQHALGGREDEYGAYAEITAAPWRSLTVIGGLRGDWNTLYDRLFLTPRLHLKWEPTATTTLRGSVGMGYRTPHLLADNMGILATGKLLQTGPITRPEQALTSGLALAQRFHLLGHAATLTFDFFRTRFSHKVNVDREYAADAFSIYQSDQGDYSNTFQFDFSWTPVERFDVFATFRWTDSRQYVRRPDSGLWEKTERPLIDRYKTLLNLQYATKFRRWVFDFTAQLNGPSRLPAALPATGTQHSPAYALLFAQVSYKVGRMELYLGCENLADYRQKFPLRGADEPFGSGFDSSVVWGPLMGRKTYAGFRLNLY